MSGGDIDRGYTFEEIRAAIHRRAGIGLLILGGVAVTGTAVVLGLPNEYHAEATVILEPYRPHAELVTPSVTPLLEDRLKIAREELLARPLLEKVVVAQDLYPAVRAKLGVDAATDELAKHLEVRPDGDSAVVVGYRTSDKSKAAPVAEAIAQGYAEANSDLRTNQAKEVLDIIEQELDTVTKQLGGAEDQVKDFRRLHDGELPEQVDGNQRDADRLAHMLADTQAYVHALEARMAGLPVAPMTPEIEHLTALETGLVGELTHAQSVFTPDHPEPQRLTRELKGLREQKAHAMAAAGDLHKEREDLRRETASLRHEAADLEARIQTSRNHAEAGARWATELSVLERDRDLLRDKYKSLMSRKVEGEVSLALEKREAPLATHVVSPASAPLEPAAPDRPRLLLVVMLLALGAAVGTGVLLESKDASLRTPAQARAQLGVPLLAVVPSLRLVKR